MPRLLGHETIAKDLKELIKKNELAHGYIFYGPSMVGKRTTALALAHFLEKEKFEVSVADEVLQDTKILSPDLKDSIGIDAVREIKNFLWQRPNASARRTLIIDDAELLTNEAQNALLKVTEEPPESSLLLIVTSDLESIMPTILSRLQKVYFGTVAASAIASWLIEEMALPKVKAAALAKQAIGKPGLASRLLNDKGFEEELGAAEKFIKAPPASRRDVIKKILESEEFSLRKFLNAVIIVLAWEKPSKTRAVLWHNVLALAHNATNFGLNPRLQLENIFYDHI